MLGKAIPHKHLSFVLVYVGDLVTTNLMKHGHKWHMDGTCQSYRRFWLLQALSTFVIIPQRSLMASITQYKSSKPVFSHGLMLLFWHATLVLVKKKPQIQQLFGFLTVDSPLSVLISKVRWTESVYFRESSKVLERTLRLGRVKSLNAPFPW